MHSNESVSQYKESVLLLPICPFLVVPGQTVIFKYYSKNSKKVTNRLLKNQFND